MNTELIYDNFEAFHTMCLSAALMSTYNCEEFDSDARKIIDFIGKAFTLPKEITNDFESCILGDMMNIGLITDYHAIASEELLSDDDKNNIELYEIKGRILEEVAVAEAQNNTISDIRIANQIKSNMKYEYFHHPYNAKLKFRQLNRIAKFGNVDAARQTAVLQTLGIGCKADSQKAEESFLKCILWGDKVSALLISELHRMTGRTDSEYYKLYSETKPSDITDVAVSQYWELAELINACIITPKKDPLINNILAHCLISAELPFHNKRELISDFDERVWRNVYVLSDKRESRIGFRVKRNG